jgi:membrane dipeptidase
MYNERFLEVISAAESEFQKNSGYISFCRSGNDLRNAIESGRIAGVISIEGAEHLGDDPDNLKTAYDLGVRMLTISWNRETVYAHPAVLEGNTGLKDKGKKLVQSAGELGVVLDVSHLSERGFFDLCEVYPGAFIASHSNAKALCPHPRNLTDEQLGEIIKRGGICGLNLYGFFIRQDGVCTLTDVLSHIEHILELGGGARSPSARILTAAIRCRRGFGAYRISRGSMRRCFASITASRL